jgi:hypothetical protein
MSDRRCGTGDECQWREVMPVLRADSIRERTASLGKSVVRTRNEAFRIEGHVWRSVGILAFLQAIHRMAIGRGYTIPGPTFPCAG